jgi:2-aminoadipate transaminase
MPIPYVFSRTAAGLKRSVMRDLMALAVSPDIISFAGGLPASDHLPIEQLQACFDAVLTRDGARALQYGPPYLPLREWLAGYMRGRGVDCAVENIFITNGAQQGLEILARLFLDEGAPEILEAITFTGIQQAAHGHGAEVRTVPMDLETGIDVEALEAALARSPRARLAVVIPNFHNPLGVSIPAAHRARLAELAARHQVPLVEDDPYSPLRYAGEAQKPIKAYDEAGAVIYLGSFSKMLAPAMRLGWMAAPIELVDRLTVLRESIDLESSQFTQRAAAEFLTRGYLEPHLAQLNAANRERRDALFAALERELGGRATWTRPEGGLFVWVTLPAAVDAAELFQAAVARQVAFIPGGAFAVEGGHANTMRLNYSNATPDKIHEGLRRLGEALKEHLAVTV